VDARALLGAGAMRYAQGTLATARVALAGALKLAEEIDEIELAAQAGNLLGHVEHSLGHVNVARDHYARSVERFRMLGLPWGLGNSLTGMATIHLATGDAATAERLLDEAVSVLPPAGPWFLVLTQHVRALLALRRGDAEGTLAIVRDSLTLIRALHDKYAFVYAMGPLAAAAVLTSDDEWAARIFGARDAVTERTGATAVVRQALDDLMQLAERDVRARLGPERWAVEYDAGQRLSVDALIQDIDRRSRRRPRA
jgi:hypothetical protein